MTLRASLRIPAALLMLALFESLACVHHYPFEIDVPRPISSKIPLRAGLVLSEGFVRHFPPSTTRPGGRHVWDTGRPILGGIEETTRLAFSEVEVVASTEEAFRSDTVQVALVPEVVVWNNDFDRPLMKIRWTILNEANRVLWQETITTQSSWAELERRGTLPPVGFSTESVGRFAGSTLKDATEAQLRELLDRLVAQPWWERSEG